MKPDKEHVLHLTGRTITAQRTKVFLYIGSNVTAGIILVRADLILNLFYPQPNMPSITLAFQRGALLAMVTWQGSQPTAAFKANRGDQCVVCEHASVCTRENTQFLLVRPSTAVDKWSQAAHKLPHVHQPAAGFTLILHPCSAKCLK